MFEIYSFVSKYWSWWTMQVKTTLKPVLILFNKLTYPPNDMKKKIPFCIIWSLDLRLLESELGRPYRLPTSEGSLFHSVNQWFHIAKLYLSEIGLHLYNCPVSWRVVFQRTTSRGMVASCMSLIINSLSTWQPVVSSCSFCCHFLSFMTINCALRSSSTK